MRRMYYRIAIVLALVATIISTSTVLANNRIIPNNSDGIPDKNLFQEILKELGKSSDSTYITSDEAEKITYLEVNLNGDRNISSLFGIGELSNLNTLIIFNNSLTSLKGVESLKKLEHLSVGKGKISSLDEIKILSNLTLFSVSGNRINSWLPLTDLEKLNTLSIKDCDLTNNDLPTICGLSQITSLSVPNNKITNISGIEKMVNLEDLDVSMNKLSVLPNLKALKKLRLEYTSFSGNKISRSAFEKCLPNQLLEKWYVNNQVITQNTKKKLKIYKLKKIKSNTKTIKGITEKKAKLVLKNAHGKKIKTVRANKKRGICSKKNLS